MPGESRVSESLVHGRPLSERLSGGLPEHGPGEHLQRMTVLKEEQVLGLGNFVKKHPARTPVLEMCDSKNKEYCLLQSDDLHNWYFYPHHAQPPTRMTEFRPQHASVCSDHTAHVYVQIEGAVLI